MNPEQRKARIEKLYQDEFDFREAMKPFHKAEMRETIVLYCFGNAARSDRYRLRNGAGSIRLRRDDNRWDVS
jgi:hypothetical protein